MSGCAKTRREENRVQLAASSRRQAGRAARRNSVGREGKERIPWDLQIAGKAESKPQSPISHASLEAACGRSGQPRCFVVAVQPRSAGHALSQAMTCTCLLCQHDNYLALQPGLSRASEQRLPKSDYRPASQTHSAFCHNRCAFCLYQPVASSLRGPFGHMVSRQPGASSVSL
jgi:DNA-directed RNA polymerase subunit M/transcription elongation factor TFIIS